MAKMEVGIVGLGKFGFSLARSLKEMGHPVIGVDRREDIVRDAADFLEHVFQADGTDPKALEQLGFKELDMAVISTGSSMEASILVVLALQELGVGRIWAKAVSAQHETVLNRLGVDQVVFPEQFVGRQLAHRIAVPGLLDYLSLGKGLAIQEHTVADQWEGKNLRDLDLRKKHNVQVIAVQKQGDKDFDFVPSADDPLERGEVLLIIGHGNDLAEIS